MTHDVFISYSSKNSQAAKAICHVLEQQHIKCWIAPRDIPAGSDYGDLIDEAILSCKVFVIIFSEPASISQWVKGELNLAFTEGKYIVPFRIDQTPLKGAMRVILNQSHWIDAYPDFESKFSDLVSGVSSFLGRGEIKEEIITAPAPKPAPAPTPAKTYKVGDYYDDGKKRGVVFEVTADGQHGKIVSLESELVLKWAANKKFGTILNSKNPSKNRIGTTDKFNGANNMRIVKQIKEWEEKYPAFAWCDSLGEGWYLPAIEELKTLLLKESVKETVNNTLELRGSKLLDFWRHWSSTEDEDEEVCAWCVHKGIGNTFLGKAICRYKGLDAYVRAVSAF